MKNGNYKIIQKEFYNIKTRNAIVLGFYNNGITPYVTWEYNEKEDSYFWGHYFENKEDALKDYHERLIRNYTIPF